MTEYQQGDFVALSDAVPAADIVMLDRVLCCYKDVDTLLARSLEKCGSVYAMSIPTSSFFSKIFFHIPIVIGKLLKWWFTPSWHDWGRIVEVIRRQGFQTVATASTVLWATYVFRRAV